MKRSRKILVRLLVGLVAIAVLLAAGGVFYLKVYLPDEVAPLSFPQTKGTIELKALNGPVNVYRDKMGIPHIYAGNLHDLFFAQGYVHAQDRFWQMDVWRHIGSGTLSEMFGSRQVKTDSFLRTLGWKRTTEKEWDGMGPQSRAILTAYAEGVNAYLADHQGSALSLEYSVLKLLSPHYEVKSWTPINSLTWAKVMAWDLGGNLRDEIERAVLLKTLTPEQVGQLFPPYPSNHPTIVDKIGDQSAATGSPAAGFGNSGVSTEVLDALQHNVALADAAVGPAGEGIGSNSWAVSGKLSATGEPLLANDPHLGIQMPSIWYQVDLRCVPRTESCPFEVAGFSFAGVPGVVVGHNDNIAWGVTNTGPDVMDLFIEKVNPDNPNQYRANGKWVDFDTRTETIKVAGGEPVKLTVRSTRHGPIISDSYGPLKDANPDKKPDFKPFKDRSGLPLPSHYAIALDWTALRPSNPFEAIWAFDKAENWDDFRAAARGFHVPAQNLLYADTKGNIGYQMPGDIPIRKKGDGRLPVPGWTGEYDWKGTIPFEQLPHALNPPKGYIVTANNKVAPDGYPYLITTDWDDGYRANRITNLIERAPGKIDIPYMRKIQGDKFDDNAKVFVPLLAALHSSFDEEQTKALALLRNWDNQCRADSSAAAVFKSFWRHVLLDTFADDLPKAYWPKGSARWNLVMEHLAQKPDDPFWDDRATKDVVETRDDILRRAFGQAVTEMQDRFGGDLSAWNWGEMHAATFRNQTLGKSGIGFIEDLFNRGPYPVGGGRTSVDATGWSVVDGYETNWLPSMRMIVDLGDLTNSLTVHTTGESGHAYSPHYDDMVPLWVGIQYYPMLWDRKAVEANRQGHLKLVP